MTGHRFEPHVGGRFLELRDSGEAALGHITAWDPPDRLAFTWRQDDWAPDEVTQVTVTFQAEAGGTRVRLRHAGFVSIRSQIGCEVGYAAGWHELLGWYAEAMTDSIKEATCT